jgi:gliding motility-associated lipoprotein GldH
MFSCDTRAIYKAHEEIEDGLWSLTNTPTFKVEVRDTTQQFNVYYLIRNAIDYPYYNLYLTHRIYDPNGNYVSGALEEIYLSDETTGKPLGSGLGDLFDHKIRFKKSYKFPKPGIYKIVVSQSMRQNPLPGIISVGVSVERTTP